MHNLNQYVDQLVEEKGFDEKDPEVIAQIKTDLLDRVENRVDAMIADNLPAEVLPEFSSILDTGGEADIQAFITKHIPDIEEKVASELLTFRTIYLS
jgi:hypothetical protein